jgi:hypothetical protein
MPPRKKLSAVWSKSISLSPDIKNMQERYRESKVPVRFFEKNNRSTTQHQLIRFNFNRIASRLFVFMENFLLRKPGSLHPHTLDISSEREYGVSS